MLRRLHYLLLRLFRRLPRRARRWVVHTISQTYTVGAICVIERADGSILLVRHSYRRRWGFPGGIVHRRENVRDTARREAREEVDLDVELVGEPTVVVDAHAGRVDVVFRARPAGDVDIARVRPTSPEIVEARWFAPERLPELQEEASDALVALARASRPKVSSPPTSASGEKPA